MSRRLKECSHDHLPQSAEPEAAVVQNEGFEIGSGSEEDDFERSSAHASSDSGHSDGVNHL